MRLLEQKADGAYRLIECFGDNIPRYAILSHTWGADDEEVTFRDVTEGTDRTKAGYRKLEFCHDQAV